MRRIHKCSTVLISCFVLAVVFLTPTTTRGDEWNLMTRFTVNQPFEVPGMTLQPNTRYVIRLYDSPSTRNVVQVLNNDETKMLTMFMAVSDERLEPADKTVFTFIETEPGYPLPVKEWFYPGRLNGLEFIYPKEQALEIAHHAKEPILAAENVSLHNLSAVKVEAISPLGPELPPTSTASITKTELPPVEEAKPAPVPEEAPAPPPAVEEKQPEQQPAEPPAIAENQPPQVEQPAAPEPAPAPAPAEEPANRELPKTAGELPLIALIGVLCLGAGLSLKVRSSRS
jgi:hypothetical protein